MASSVLVVLVISLFITCSKGQAVPAIFAFGDSLVDVGSRGVLSSPYGMDLFPSGRYSNGRLVIDFIAEHLGLPMPPPFPAAVRENDYNGVSQSGVNFGSAGSGIMPQHLGYVLSTQIGMFQAIQSQITRRIGERAAMNMTSKSIFYLCTGNNDMNNYYRTYRVGAPSSYQQRILSLYSAQIQRLYNLGARKFVIVGLSAGGCIPSNVVNGACAESPQTAAVSFNTALANMIDELRGRLPGSHFVEPNFYDLMVDVHNNPSNYGLTDASNACCETADGSFCTPGGGVCADRDTHAFWDGFHQAQSFNRIAADLWWSGSQSNISPMNIQQLAAV